MLTIKDRFPLALTKRQREVVSVIRERFQIYERPCFVMLPSGGRTTGKTDLYVPVQYEGLPPAWERLWRVHSGTVKAIVLSGCVSLGPAQPGGAFRGLPDGSIVSQIIPDWDWAEQRGGPLHVSAS